MKKKKKKNHDMKIERKKKHFLHHENLEINIVFRKRKQEIVTNRKKFLKQNRA